MTTTTVTDWIDEEDFFARRRRDNALRKIETKWSGGSSPILLIKAGYEHKEEWEKCFWYDYPSSVRCFDCEWEKKCPNFKA